MHIDINKFDFSKAQYETTKQDVSEVARNYNEMDLVPINSFEEFLKCLVDELIAIHEDAIAFGDEEEIENSCYRFTDIIMVFHLNQFVEGAMTFEK